MGRGWHADGSLLERGITRNRSILPGIFYFWKGERPRDPDAPELEGTGEIKLESVDRANGYFIVTRSDGPDHFHAKTSGIYLRADPGDKAVLDSKNAAERAALIERRIEEWRTWRTPDASLASLPSTS